MILDENGEKCSAKELANEILCRCLEDISSYLRENPCTTAKLTPKENLALNDQLVKQAKRCFRLLGVHEDDMNEIFDPDDPRAQPGSASVEGEVMTDEDKQAMRDALAAEDAADDG